MFLCTVVYYCVPLTERPNAHIEHFTRISRAHAPLNPFLFCALDFLPVSSSAVKIRIESPLMDFSGCTVGFGLTVHHLLLVAIGINSGLNIIEEAPNGGRGKPPFFGFWQFAARAPVRLLHIGSGLQGGIEEAHLVRHLLSRPRLAYVGCLGVGVGELIPPPVTYSQLLCGPTNINLETLPVCRLLHSQQVSIVAPSLLVEVWEKDRRPLARTMARAMERSLFWRRRGSVLCLACLLS